MQTGTLLWRTPRQACYLVRHESNRGVAIEILVIHDDSGVVDSRMFHNDMAAAEFAISQLHEAEALGAEPHLERRSGLRDRRRQPRQPNSDRRR